MNLNESGRHCFQHVDISKMSEVQGDIVVVLQPVVRGHMRVHFGAQNQHVTTIDSLAAVREVSTPLIEMPVGNFHGPVSFTSDYLFFLTHSYPENGDSRIL
jgi:hypothetical protein